MMDESIKFFYITFCISVLLSCGNSKEVTSTSESNTDSELPIKKLSIFKTLQENNHLPVEERIALYHQLKKDFPKSYNFDDEQELNRYGYELLMKDKTKEAIEIFILLVAEFPNSFNPYDSLGEAYLKDGNKELAILNYEKSVELNPLNYAAVDQITILNGLELLVTDWGKEFFHFPIHFAPEIPYLGVEEVVFPKNWRKPDSADFWSYVIVWALDNKESISAAELEITLKQYFDGLMDGVKSREDGEIIKTSAYFKENSNQEDSVDFIGNLTIFDAFATHQPLKLNARIYSNYCEEKQKLILLFRFSPQEYNQPTWDLLRTVKVRKSVCDK